MTARRPSADKAVAELLAELDTSRQERSQPAASRRKQRREREKAAARNRIMLDLHPVLTKNIKSLASKWECPTSQVANLLIYIGLLEFEAGRVDPSDYYSPTKSPRYSRVLKLPINDE